MTEKSRTRASIHEAACRTSCRVRPCEAFTCPAREPPMVRIEAPHFCAGIIQGGESAPILYYMKGWTLKQMRAYCEKNGWTLSVHRGDPK